MHSVESIFSHRVSAFILAIQLGLSNTASVTNVVSLILRAGGGIMPVSAHSLLLSVSLSCKGPLNLRDQPSSHRRFSLERSCCQKLSIMASILCIVVYYNSRMESRFQI